MVEQETNRIVVERRGFRADQFLKMSNFRAHYLHTGPEILEQAGGRIDAFAISWDQKALSRAVPRV